MRRARGSWYYRVARIAVPAMCVLAACFVVERKLAERGETERTVLWPAPHTGGVWRVPASVSGELQIAVIGPVELKPRTDYRLTLAGRYPRAASNAYVVVDFSDWHTYDPSDAETIIAFDDVTSSSRAHRTDTLEFNSGSSVGRVIYLRAMSRCGAAIEFERVTLGKLRAQAGAMEQARAVITATRAHGAAWAALAAAASVMLVLARRGRVIWGSATALAMAGVLASARPEWLAGRHDAGIVIQPDQPQALRGTFMHAVDLVLRPHTEYWLHGEYRQCGVNIGDANTWVIDIIDDANDREEHELHVPVKHSAEKMPAAWQRFDKVINSRGLRAAKLRLMGTVVHGIEVRGVRVRPLPSAYGWVLRWRGVLILGCLAYAVGLCLHACMVRQRVRERLCWWLERPWVRYALPAGAYVAGAALFTVLMWRRGGGMPSSRAVYEVMCVPLLAWVALYVAGWPFARLMCGRRCGHRAEALLAPVAGAMLLALTVSLSAFGLRTPASVAVVGVAALAGWAWQLWRHRYPVAPDRPASAVLACACMLMWLTLCPVATHARTGPFTNTNADLGIYAPATLWMRLHTLEELKTRALRREEPAYVAYLAYRYRETPLPLELGTYAMYAGLSFITGTAAYSFYPVGGGMSVALIVLAAAGVVRVTRLMTAQVAAWGAVVLATHFLMPWLFWESFTSSILGIALVLPAIVLGISALRHGSWRWAVAGGVVLGTVLVTYVSVLPLIVCGLGMGGAWCLLEQAVRRRWRRMARVPVYGLAMVLVMSAVAPAYVRGYVADLANPRGFNRSIRSNTSGGENYPQRSMVLMAGLSEIGSAHIPVPRAVHRTAGLAVAWSGVMLCAWFAVYMARGAARMPYGVLVASAAVLVLGTYCMVPNRYMYFKSLGFVAPMFSMVAAAAWLAAYGRYTHWLMRRVLLGWFALAAGLRADALASMPWHFMPQRYMGEGIRSLESLQTIVPHHEGILVDFGDVYYSPHVMAMLWHWPLTTTKPFGYIWWQYRTADPRYVLTQTPRQGQAPVWSNTIYYLYHAAGRGQ